jgi:hypothetical protein
MNHPLYLHLWGFSYPGSIRFLSAALALLKGPATLQLSARPGGPDDPVGFPTGFASSDVNCHGAKVPAAGLGKTYMDYEEIRPGLSAEYQGGNNLSLVIDGGMTPSRMENQPAAAASV